ncbi:DUF2934 domain-containing protein [Bradyrhizobium sp. CCGUVB1N3]|uniref:DUF2934 domain-containing protein n=1 Tax=Bradyrhizobium sp. CCGUVB1N3 TaxID=2949629 RepID=UPI0020B20A86|nr:DUF2934 domain-containing protein [Bradyrhizobium sp. CCGUVB1N3]MCP3477343.1 DUF2934 domain-containing protein [Bradyrhizobium sp. CCGUVB1N3]
MRARAHHHREEAGRPEGRAGEFWHRAERAVAFDDVEWSSAPSAAILCSGSMTA